MTENRYAGKPTKHAIVSTLVELGVTHAFTLPGLGVTWMLDEFYEVRGQLRVVLTRSEQVASIMAQVVGRLTGKPGVFMGQGPFASTTGAFGILEAYFAGSPMLVLTDTSCYDGFGMYGVYQTMTGDYGAADVRTVLKTMTKATYYATETHEAVYAIQQAYRQASLPRTGPCAVVLKSPIIRREMSDQKRVQLYPSQDTSNVLMPEIALQAASELVAAINQSKRPVAIVGNGLQNPRGRKAIAALAKKCGIAVATSYNGKGVVDETAEYSVGMLGTWGSKVANAAVREADLLLVIGASLGADYLRFREPGFIRPGDQKIIQIDVDPRNLGWVYPVDLAINAEAANALEAISEGGIVSDKSSMRLNWIKQVQQKCPDPLEQDTPAANGFINNSTLIRVLDAFLTPDHLLTLDAGTNRIWSTIALKIRTPGQLIVPGGIGGMGWGAPAAAAAKLVHPEKKVISLTGDGGFAMTMNVLSTCVQENLPITVVVANNGGLGMVRDNMKGKKIAVDFAPIDFAAIAEGMGCLGLSANSAESLAEALQTAQNSGRTAVINVSIDPASTHINVSDY